MLSHTIYLSIIFAHASCVFSMTQYIVISKTVETSNPTCQPVNSNNRLFANRLKVQSPRSCPSIGKKGKPILVDHVRKQPTTQSFVASNPLPWRESLNMGGVQCVSMLKYFHPKNTHTFEVANSIDKSTTNLT